jgi:hypothetical protein
VDLNEELVALLASLDREGVDYALIGGLAVAVWGAPRVSKLAGHEHLMVDLMLVGPHLQSAWDSRRRIPFEGGVLSVISRESLIAMKIAAGRQQDLLDVEKLKDLDR